MNTRTLLLVLAASLSALACEPSRRGSSDDDDDDEDSSSAKKDGGSSRTDGGSACSCGERECGAPPGCSTSCGTCDEGQACTELGLCAGTPASCLADTPCVSNADCASGFRCNETMNPPQCHKLYCAPSGGACAESFFCQTGLLCIAQRCGVPGPTRVVGTAFARQRTLESALFDATTNPPQLVIGDREDMCEQAQRGRTLANAFYVIFSSDLAIGVSSRDAYVFATDATCEAPDFRIARGTLEILTSSSGEVTGTLSVEGDGTSLQGTFKATPCQMPSGVEPVCENAPP